MKNFLRHARAATPAAAVLLALCLCAAGARAQDEFDEHGRFVNGVSESWVFAPGERYTEGEAAAARALWKRIGEAAGGGEWAGDYTLGGGMPENLRREYLRWSPQSGYVYFSIYTCMSSVVVVGYGGATASPTLVELFPQTRLTQSTRGFRGGDGHKFETTLKFSRFVPVKWGEAHYLVPEDQLAAFGDYAAGLGMFNEDPDFSAPVWVDYFVKLGDAPPDPAATPVLPAGYERFARRPVTAEITAVVKRALKRERGDDGSLDYYSLTTVKLNAGRADGVRRGMILRVAESAEEEEVEVTSVGRDSSVGVIVREVDEQRRDVYADPQEEGRVKPYPAVAAGWRLTTNPRRRED